MSEKRSATQWLFCNLPTDFYSLPHPSWNNQRSVLTFLGYNTLDGLIYGTFILAEKGLWHLIDFGQSFYVAAALNEQIRKRKREKIQKESTNNG